MSALWKDVTVYSPEDLKRIPKAWQLQVGRFRVRLGVLTDDQQGWEATAPGFFESRKIEAVDERDAKDKALRLLENSLKEVLNRLTN